METLENKVKYFKTYRDFEFIQDSKRLKHVITGKYSYYSGYYHGHKFDDCVLYLDELDNDQNEKNVDRLIIGKFCSIASGVKFMLGGSQGHNHNWITNFPLDDFRSTESIDAKGNIRKGDTVLENDVWIGFDSLIMPGVKISNGAVIGSRSVVTKDIGPYEIWAGNPASFIRKRFTDNEIAKLLNLCWWDWNEQDIKKNIDYLQSNDVDFLYKKTFLKSQ